MPVQPFTDVARTTVYLVRHAHADWSADEQRGLSAAGTLAADAVAHLLRDWPVAAIYTSPLRRAVDTVMPLARSMGLAPSPLPDLREREMPVLPLEDFHRTIVASWQSPDVAPRGGESNAAAQARGVAVLRDVVRRHRGQHVVLATHGNLLALILNTLDPSLGYERWTQLSFPDVYRLEFEGDDLVGLTRLWGPTG